MTETTQHDHAPEAPKLRADAARNRARLVEAARTLFLAAAPDAEVSLEQVAREAGVGIGTLYRHFPTRLDLLEAVYREEVDGLQQAAERLIPGRSAYDALELWLEVFIDYAATKKHIFHELIEATGRDSALMTHSRAVMTATAEKMVGRAQAAGEVRDDVTPGDVIRLAGGCTMMPNFDRAQSRRILQVVMAGLRPA
ncbi:MAG TPA: helix-turn-helix domain-containing protein [Marmoricola sp.]|nr:helix-turn-helix domain-containing protein [Marmoricola sp.]